MRICRTGILTFALLPCDLGDGITIAGPGGAGGGEDGVFCLKIVLDDGGAAKAGMVVAILSARVDIRGTRLRSI